MEAQAVSGIAFQRDEAKLTIKGIPDIPGAASKYFSLLAKLA